MPLYYEVAYETGRTSVMCCEDDEEAKAGLAEQNRRAAAGEPGGPSGAPAERVARVFVYKKHPNEYNPEQTMSADVLKKEVEALIDKFKDDNGVVSVDRLSLEVRGLSHPMIDGAREAGFESIFKMKADRELDMAFLSEGGE